ncbi:MAG: MATE family efflux transporter [Clostridiales bacterium]|nr:MATE family efflux transporter [Clostridiales bacterium]
MSTKNKTRNLSQGHPLPQILLFSLPLILGTMFQQIYSFADTVIVGRCLGADALAAVGNTGALNFLILGFIQGACVGFGIPIAQSFGAGDVKDLHRYLWNGAWLCATVSMIFTVSMLLISRRLLTLISTPAGLLDMSNTYISVIFLGISATALYNYSASTLRAMGDSKHPFYFLLVSSFLNIALDYLFILWFQMGVAGAAIATVLSQLVSGILNTWWLFRHISLIRVRKEELAVSVPHLKKLSIIGLPMGFEYSVSAIGAIVMQNAINTLGAVAMAAQTAGDRLRQFFTLPMESVGMAIATYAGQNYGARRMDRVKSGIGWGILIQTVYCVFCYIILFFAKAPLARFVLGAEETEAVAGAVRYLSIISCLFIFHGSLMILRNTLQGLGYTTHAVFSGVGELLGRSLGGFLATNFFGFTAVCFSNPLAWIFALCYCAVMLFRVFSSFSLSIRPSMSPNWKSKTALKQ